MAENNISFGSYDNLTGIGEYNVNANGQLTPETATPVVTPEPIEIPKEPVAEQPKPIEIPKEPVVEQPEPIEIPKTPSIPVTAEDLTGINTVTIKANGVEVETEPPAPKVVDVEPEPKAEPAPAPVPEPAPTPNPEPVKLNSVDAGVVAAGLLATQGRTYLSKDEQYGVSANIGGAAARSINDDTGNTVNVVGATLSGAARINDNTTVHAGATAYTGNSKMSGVGSKDISGGAVELGLSRDVSDKTSLHGHGRYIVNNADHDNAVNRAVQLQAGLSTLLDNARTRLGADATISRGETKLGDNVTTVGLGGTVSHQLTEHLSAKAGIAAAAGSGVKDIGVSIGLGLDNRGTKQGAVVIPEATNLKAQVEPTIKEATKISLGNKEMFDHDKFAIKDSGKKTLEELAAKLTNPNILASGKSVVDELMANGQKINLAGFADATGKDAYNLDLSKKRVEVVKDFLVSKGVPAAALETTAHGEQKAQFSNEQIQQWRRENVSRSEIHRRIEGDRRTDIIIPGSFELKDGVKLDQVVGGSSTKVDLSNNEVTKAVKNQLEDLNLPGKAVSFSNKVESMVNLDSIKATADNLHNTIKTQLDSFKPQ